MARVGIFAGTFDPVHNGHVAFAFEAMKMCRLNKVVFLPERQPRGKVHVTDIEHRLVMLQLATGGQPGFEVTALADEQFTIANTLPQLQKIFPVDQLVMLLGSDVAGSLPHWPDVQKLYNAVEFAIGVRMGDKPARLPVAATIVPTTQPHVAASHIRGGEMSDVAPAVRDYIYAHHLYAL